MPANGGTGRMTVAPIRFAQARGARLAYQDFGDGPATVMDAAEIDRAVLYGASEGGPMALLFAVTYPERVEAELDIDVAPFDAG